MTTIGEVIGVLEGQLFVGREEERARFRQWLSSDSRTPEILNVTGRGGIGKSALLGAFAREAHSLGKTVLLVDSRDFPHTPQALLDALGDESSEDTLAYLNRTHPLILFDTFEEMGDLSRYLRQEFLPALDTKIKVVIAGRYPLGHAWSEDPRWHHIVIHLPLTALSVKESREYLRSRGLNKQEMVEDIVNAAGGNPLALSLAADMALQLDIRDFGMAPERHLMVRSLVERLLRDVGHSSLRDLLQAAAVIRQFDEAALSAGSGQEEIGDAFDQLCRLSVVRPTEHGLMLHDDVRHALAEDLRWRRPDRYTELRLRALAYFRERTRVALPSERARLVAERLYLWENGFVQAMLFGEHEQGQAWMEPGGQADHEDIRRLWFYVETETYAKELYGDGPPEWDEKFLEWDEEFLNTILSYPATRLRVVRDRDGSLLGFSTALPVCRETIPLIDIHPSRSPLVHAYWNAKELEALPATPESTNVFYLLHVGYGNVLPDAVRAALLRDMFGLLALGGLYLVSFPLPSYKALFEACGFEFVPGARNWTVGPKHPVDGYVLDLQRIGVENWIEAIISGKRPPKALNREEMQQELQEVLLRWRDDARLARSPLAQIPAIRPANSEAERPAALRETIVGALASARTNASPSQIEAYRALELAYIKKTVSSERAAELLNVSRSTYYRLVKRGIDELVDVLMNL